MCESVVRRDLIDERFIVKRNQKIEIKNNENEEEEKWRVFF